MKREKEKNTKKIEIIFFSSFSIHITDKQSDSERKQKLKKKIEEIRFAR